VSATSRVPLMPGGNSGTISGENSAVGPTDLPVEAEWRWVTPDYFKAIGTTLITGRAFTEADSEGATPVAIVDESFAARYYANEDPVGKRIKRGKLDSTRPWMTIVASCVTCRAGASMRRRVYKSTSRFTRTPRLQHVAGRPHERSGPALA